MWHIGVKKETFISIFLQPHLRLTTMTSLMILLLLSAPGKTSAADHAPLLLTAMTAANPTLTATLMAPLSFPRTARRDSAWLPTSSDSLRRLRDLRKND